MNPRDVYDESSEFFLIRWINTLISLPLQKLLMPLKWFAPVIKIFHIIPVMYFVWGLISSATIFSATITASYALDIPLASIYTPWVELFTDVSTVIETVPEVVAVVFVIVYALTVYVAPPPQPAVTTQDTPNNHSKSIFIGLGLLSAVGLFGLVSGFETIGILLTLGGVLLASRATRKLIEDDRNSRNIHYDESFWLIITRVGGLGAVVYILVGGSVFYGGIFSVLTFGGVGYFLSRRHRGPSSLYTRIESVSQLVQEYPRQFGYLEGELEEPDMAELEASIAESKEVFRDILDQQGSNASDELLEGLYWTVKEFEEEYVKYSSKDSVNAEAVYDMSKSDVRELHTQASELESRDNVAEPVRRVSTRLRKVTEQTLEDWDRT